MAILAVEIAVLEKFKEAIRETSPVPCDDCRNFDMCRLNRLACTDFDRYTQQYGEMTSRRPSRKVYNDLFTDFGYSEGRHGE